LGGGWGLRRPTAGVGMTAQHLGELGGAAEGIGDQLAGGERERRVDSTVALGDQMRSRRKGPGVEPGEALQRGEVGWGPQAEGDRGLGGGASVAIELPVRSPFPKRHGHQYAPG
jgi:hypothetical protein